MDFSTAVEIEGRAKIKSFTYEVYIHNENHPRWGYWPQLTDKQQVPVPNNGRLPLQTHHFLYWTEKISHSSSTTTGSLVRKHRLFYDWCCHFSVSLIRLFIGTIFAFLVRWIPALFFFFSQFFERLVSRLSTTVAFSQACHCVLKSGGDKRAEKMSPSGTQLCFILILF